MTDRALQMLGLCARAGKIVSGEAACEQAVKHGGAHLLALDDNASPRAKKDMHDACAYASVKWIAFSAGSLGAAIGKPGRKCVAVMDEGFARRILEIMKETTGTENNRGWM